MTYLYDSESKQITKSGKVVGWATAGAAATAVIALLAGILSGTPGLLTTFSSVPAPPGPPTPWVEGWYKNVYRNDAQVAEWWSTPIAVTETTTLAIADRITTTTPFTLTEIWDSDVLSLTAFITETGGTVISATSALTWIVAAPVVTTTRYELVKSWEVITRVFTLAGITETLITGGGTQSVTVWLEPGTPPTPTPTPTATPRPTFTPQPYTPRPWIETPFPSSTPCAGIGCGGGPEITYKTYFPLVLREYP
jgi:hypothetical protein